MIPIPLIPITIFYQPGQQTTASSRLAPTTIMNVVNLTSSTAQNSSSVDTSNVPKKSLKITLTSTGTISDYLVKITALSSQTDSNYAEIVSEIYEVNGTYHWNIEDVGRYFMIQAQSLGTADGSNYVTVTVVLEGIS